MARQVGASRGHTKPSLRAGGGVVECWGVGALGCWGVGVLGPVVEWWGVGVLGPVVEWWSGGALGCWGGGVVGWWVLGYWGVGVVRWSIGVALVGWWPCIPDSVSEKPALRNGISARAHKSSKIGRMWRATTKLQQR